MTASHLRWMGVALFALLATTACASADVPPPEPPGPERASTPSNAELEAIYRARIASARERFTEADAHFMSGMIGHHAQAVVMARLAPTHGAGPSVRTLAARIINAQEDEISIMQQWLRDRGRPVPEVHVMGTTLMIHGADHDMLMPGMITPEEMSQLDEARGLAFDRLFLTFMIQHHQGAVTMVQDLFATDGAGQDPTVFKFASDVHVDQVTEIARMESMLSALPPSDPAR